MGYIINAIKAFGSTEINEIDEGKLSQDEKAELKKIEELDKTEAIENSFLKSLKEGSKSKKEAKKEANVYELPKRKIYREVFKDGTDGRDER